MSTRASSDYAEDFIKFHPPGPKWQPRTSERNELCDIQLLVLEPSVGEEEAVDPRSEVGVDPPGLSAKGGGEKRLDGDSVEEMPAESLPMAQRYFLF